MSYRFAIIGAGIAGTSLGYWLSQHESVLILEREAHPGYHTTGRSAAMFIETYGPPLARALTVGSRSFFESPPTGFTEHPLLTPRGILLIATAAQRYLLDAAYGIARDLNVEIHRLSPAEALARVPVLRVERLVAATYEPDPTDIDVNALHQGFLNGIRHHGGTLLTAAEVTALAWRTGGWRVETTAGVFEVETVVNAAGAWCDVVAQLAGVPPIGLTPKRRSAFVFALPPGVEPVSSWPVVMGADESFYFKPEAGMLLGSPANVDPTPPHDVRPEEIDIATGIARIEEATTLSIRRPTRTWAGLRSFTPDGELVGGYDPAAPGFFWLAGQGGYGIQTAAAMGQTCSAILLGQPLPPPLAALGISAERLSPLRLRG
ncbi:MAG: FAD-binding oxidoreductase [Deltaproteobacteria bacterium]|nr:FAD-binding oxidoreductase [Deltaproteobacteria bacterium]